MSELLVNTIKKADGTGSLTVPAESGTVVTTASPSLGRRNLIINGAMQVAQRGTSVTNQNPNTGYYHTVDRLSYRRYGTWSGVTGVNMSQETSSPPDDFAYYLRVSTTGNESAPAQTGMSQLYKVEQGDMNHLNWGTSSAKSATLSFYVRSSVTGTFSVHFQFNNTSSYDSYVAEYTISSANTWERKTITLTGPTTGGKYATANDTGLLIYFYVAADNTDATNATSSLDQWLGASAAKVSTNQSTAVSATSGATWDITGVQLEVGSVATPFEHRSYGEELALCQRYYFRLVGEANKVYAVGHNYGNSVRTLVYPPTTFRALPTIEYVGPTTFYRKNGSATNNINTTGNPWTIQNSTKDLLSLYATISDTEDGASGNLYITGTGCHLSFSAEL